MVTAVGDGFEPVRDRTVHDGSTANPSTSVPRPGRRKRLVGLLLLGVTILLWTVSNFLSSTIFADHTYSKPYLITYIDTSFFILPPLLICIKKAYATPEELEKWKEEIKTGLGRGYALLRRNDTTRPSSPENAVVEDDDEAYRAPLCPNIASYDARDGVGELPSALNATPLTLAETAMLSLEFCILWFLANYFAAGCLEYTTVASATILTSTSSVFTLIFGVMYRVETLTLRKLTGVLASLAGVVLVSTIDISGRSSDEHHRGDFPMKTSREIAIGDCIAFLSAVIYGLYAVIMRKRIPDETRIDMTIFFGFVGMINVLALWPGLILLHVTGIESFQLPPTGTVTLIIIFNAVGSLIGDIAWSYAVLLTSPVVVAVGLSMTIPLSLIGEIVLNHQTAGPWYWIGACVVLLSFILVNYKG